MLYFDYYYMNVILIHIETICMKYENELNRKSNIGRIKHLGVEVYLRFGLVQLDSFITALFKLPNRFAGICTSSQPKAKDSFP